MGVSRDNHFVPQMYLRNWCISGKDKLFVYRLLVPNENMPVWTECSVKNTGFLKNLYVRVEDDQELDDFETGFNELFEAPAKLTLDKAISGSRMTPDDWSILSDFILAQFLRTPSFFFDVQEWGVKNIESILQLQLDQVAEIINDGQPFPPTKRNQDAMLLPIKIELIHGTNKESQTELQASTVVGKNLWLYAIKTMTAPDSPVFQLFHKMKWKIVTASEGITWQTCDNPVAIVNVNTGDICTIGQRGLLGNDRIVVFPISPRKAIIGTQIHVFDHHFTADLDFSMRIKRAIINNSFMFIYSDHDDDDVIKMKKRIVDQSEYFRIQTEFSEWYSKYKTKEAQFLGKKRIATSP